MPYASPAQAAIPALVKLFTAAVAGQLDPTTGAQVEVIDSADLGTSAFTAVFVGWTGWQPAGSGTPPVGADTRPSTTIIATTGGLGGNRDREQASIHCCAQCLNGDSDIVAARVFAYRLRDLCAGAVAANRNLGGAIQGVATIGGGGLRPQQLSPPNGSLATVLFDIDTDAFTTL